MKFMNNNIKNKNKHTNKLFIVFVFLLSLGILINLFSNSSAIMPSVLFTSIVPNTNTCSLFGGTGFGNYNNWMWINVIVLIISLLIISFIYMISRFFSQKESQKFTQIMKIEIIQVIISAVILVMLLGFTTSACGITKSIATSLGSQSGYNFPSSNPFVFADYYVGDLANNIGIKLLLQIYTESIGFNIDSMIFQNSGSLIFDIITASSSTLKNTLEAIKSATSFSGNLSGWSLNVNFETAIDLGVTYGLLSDLLIGFFAPIVIVGIGLLYILWLILPVIQYTAFTVVLPVALIFRMIAFSGFGGGTGVSQSVGLKSVANQILALAIALYIIFPLTIVFNAWAIHWIFSSNNPSYSYLHSTYVLNKIKPSNLFAANPITAKKFKWFGVGIPSIFSILGTAITGNIIWSIIDPNIIVQDVLNMVNEIAQYDFTVFLMIAIDFSIVLGFATGLSKALNTNLI